MLQPQQPQQSSFCFHPSPTSKSSKAHHQSGVFQNGQHRSCEQMMSIQYKQNEQKLHRLTLILEEREQIANTSINQIISYQDLVECVKDLADHYVERALKISRIRKMEGLLQTKQMAVAQMRMNSEARKGKIEEFRKKMQIHILGTTPSIRKLLAYSTTHNIRKIMEESIAHNVHEIIHNTHPCWHNNNSGHSKSEYKYKNKCTQNCRLGELLEFLVDFKSQKLCGKIQEMWTAMEKEVFQEISNFVRVFGGELVGDEGLEENERMLEKQVMNLKVDMQILRNQIRQLHQRIGIASLQEKHDFQHFIHEIISNIQQLSYGDECALSTCPSKINRLSSCFRQYVEHVAGSYHQEYSGQRKEQLELRIQAAALEQISLTLAKAIDNSQKRMSIEEEIAKVQKNMHCLQLELEQARAQAEAENQASLSWSKQTEQTGNMTSKLKINRRYQIEALRFKVIKIMHISTVGLARNINTSYAYSRASSRVSLASQAHTRRSSKSSSSSIATDRSSNNGCCQRIIQFSKHKLILRKQNPHFHEQIEVKRITTIKIRSRTLLHVYFRKGYMSLQFVRCDDDPENLARSWVDMFQVVYYEYAGQIQYGYEEGEYEENERRQIDKQNALVNSNLIIQQQSYKIQTTKEQEITNFVTFQKNKQIYRGIFN